MKPLFGDLEGYYRRHAGIYDLTRWTFLFGRERILRLLASKAAPENILEVGCGTGKNLAALAKAFPKARLTGLDLSASMLDLARQRLSDCQDRLVFHNRPYDTPVGGVPETLSGGSRRGESGPFDLILFSYTLSMINPGWDKVLDNARADLSASGTIAVVDFNDSPSSLFRYWMKLNHVEVDGHLLPGLSARFSRRASLVRPVYGGLWSYFIFLGRPMPDLAGKQKGRT